MRVIELLQRGLEQGMIGFDAGKQGEARAQLQIIGMTKDLHSAFVRVLHDCGDTLFQAGT
ncbi:hypothetical protein D3C79_960030 [compost metagenome]